MFFSCLRTSLRNKEIGLNQFCTYIGIPILERGKVGYDLVDEFINGLICIDDPPEANLTLKPGMVFYKNTCEDHL